MGVKESGGVILSSLDVIQEFVDDVESGDIDDGDRYVHRDHPLVVLVGATLESISAANLNETIIGFSRRSQTKLITERRKLEDADERDSLQKLIYYFELLSSLIRESGYGHGGDPDRDVDFFESFFPTWLDRLCEWAAEEEFDDLARRAAEVSTNYDAVTYDIVEVT